MNRKPYSAGAVKFSFWFIEFRKTVQLLAEGKSFSEIKLLNEQENIYSASTKARAQMIYFTVTARIKMLDPGFYPVLLSSDIATQKMFALVAALAHDTLFFDFHFGLLSGICRVLSFRSLTRRYRHSSKYGHGGHYGPKRR